MSSPSSQSKSVRSALRCCDLSRQKIQAIADLLLLSTDLRPVTTDYLVNIIDSFDKCRDTVNHQAKRIGFVIGEVMSQLHSVTGRWEDIGRHVGELCELMTVLIECSTHTAYLVAVEHSNCQPAMPGIVDRYKVFRAYFEIQQCCSQFKSESIDDLTPDHLVDMCSTISKYLSHLSEACKVAGNLADEQTNRDHFKLCVKTVTSAASALLQCVKCLKSSPTEIHQRRCIAFGDALVSSCSALATFATEPQFLGKSAQFSVSAVDAHKDIRSECMNSASLCVQWCKQLRDLSFDTGNSHVRSKLTECSQSIEKSNIKLLQAIITSKNQSNRFV